jgi:hypothetical protein
MILFIENVYNGQIHRHRKQMSSCQGLEWWEEVGMSTDGYGVSLWDGGNALKLIVVMAANFCEYTLNCTLKG